MYINDVHILLYVVIGLIGLFVGRIVEWCNIRLPEYKKIITRDFFSVYLKKYKPKYIIMIIIALIYISLLYIFGLGNNILDTISLIKYAVLTPMLISVFMIDYKHQIIPNRLNLTIFETGLAFAFLEGISNLSVGLTLGIDRFLGMIVGGGIFLLITLIGGLIAGKEAMGFGDVKLMGALGLFFGWVNIIIISLIAFLLGAIISIILLITKIKKTHEYIPFGPFIVIGAFITMLIPYEYLQFILIKIFTLGMA